MSTRNTKHPDPGLDIVSSGSSDSEGNVVDLTQTLGPATIVDPNPGSKGKALDVVPEPG